MVAPIDLDESGDREEMEKSGPKNFEMKLRDYL